MAGAITINPNQPMPPVLSSNVCPPPLWPLPVANWVSLPTVAAGFPVGPFTPPTFTPGTGEYPGDSFCPGSGMVVPEPAPPTPTSVMLPIESQRAFDPVRIPPGGSQAWDTSQTSPRGRQRSRQPVERSEEPGAE